MTETSLTTRTELSFKFGHLNPLQLSCRNVFLPSLKMLMILP